MENSLFLIQGQLDAELVFKAECSYCYNTAEIDTESRREAAKQLHSLGWRFANKVRIDDVIVAGLVCPDCSEKMNFLNQTKKNNKDSTEYDE
jgi:hypothetical protein